MYIRERRIIFRALEASCISHPARNRALGSIDLCTFLTFLRAISIIIIKRRWNRGVEDTGRTEKLIMVKVANSD